MKHNEYSSALKHFENNDILIYNLMLKFGAIQLKKRRNYFHALTTSIIGQQLSIYSAKAIITKFNNYFNNEITPEKILNTNHDTLRLIGLSNAKAKYVRDLAEKLIFKEIKLIGISKKNDNDIITELTKVKGIGPWTAHMFLIFVLGRKNVLAEGDLGIKKSIMLNYNLKNLPTSEEVIKISKKHKWEPFNTYACMYLWKSIDEE